MGKKKILIFRASAPGFNFVILRIYGKAGNRGKVATFADSNPLGCGAARKSLIILEHIRVETWEKEEDRKQRKARC